MAVGVEHGFIQSTAGGQVHCSLFLGYPDGGGVCVGDAFQRVQETAQQVVEAVCGIDAGDHFVEDLQRSLLEVMFIEQVRMLFFQRRPEAFPEPIQVCGEVGKTTVGRCWNRVGIAAFAHFPCPGPDVYQRIQQVVLYQ